MSRRRSAMHLQVWLDVLCPRGHRVGAVFKLVEPHPRAGTYGTAGDAVYRDAPDVTEDSGRVRAVCSCGADVQVGWRRAKAALDEYEARGKNTGEIQG